MMEAIAGYENFDPAKSDFVAYLLTGPKVDVLEIERSRDPGREVDL